MASKALLNRILRLEKAIASVEQHRQQKIVILQPDEPSPENSHGVLIIRLGACVGNLSERALSSNSLPE